MKVLAHTDRLILREFAITDATDMFNLNVDPRNIRYTGIKPFQSLDEATKFLQSYDQYKIHGFGRWAVILKDDHSFLGWCGLKKNEEGYVDLGYRFFYKHWGKGYATESALAALQLGFTTFNLKEIIGRVARKNQASIRVLEKIGFTFWKEQSCNGIADSLYYRIEKDHWVKK